jgi:hypothetical protein
VKGGAKFGDADCSSAGGGWEDVAIPTLEFTELALNATGSQVIELELAGAEVELIGSGLKCQECTIYNMFGLIPNTMFVTGFGGSLVYTEMHLAAPFGTNCEVKDPTTGPGTVKTEELSFRSLDWKAMRIEPLSGLNYMVIHLVSKPGKVCSIAGTFPVEGDVGIGLSGANFTLGTLRGELRSEFGPVPTSGTATASAGVSAGERHPLVLTAT